MRKGFGKAVGLLVLLSPVGFLVLGYFSSHESCEQFRKISNDRALNARLRDDLSVYMARDSVLDELRDTAGEVFWVREFGDVFESKVLASVGIDQGRINLIIRSDRKDKRFVEPFELEEIGINYSRASLIYPVIKKKGVLELSAKANVLCERNGR